MLLLLGFAFLSGLVTILAPCIWPLLPIILSSSASHKGHRRPLGITLGIMLSFTVFTLTLSSLVKLFNFDPNILRLFAVIIIIFFGLSLLIPALSRIMELAISRLSGKLRKKGQTQGNGFIAGFITGLSLGIVWSPCAGPILATIATLAATGQVSLQVILVTVAYVCGVGIPLFILAYGGQQIFARTRFISPFTGRIQQVFGVIMLITALAIYTNYDKVLQVQLLDTFPQFSQNLTWFESNPAVKNQLDSLKGSARQDISLPNSNSDLFNTNTPAPDFIGATKWLNLPTGEAGTDKPLTIKELKGKVVLVDFWTYTCINCIRTLPHVTAWYDKYKNEGFVVIGAHTPEFEFEKDTSNVFQAIKQNKIHYPVVQDNNYAVWKNFNNEYWPAEYLIDATGNIRRTHFGEGEYDRTEMAIQVLLKEAGKKVNASLETMPDQTPRGQNSPETYLSAKRMQYYFPNGNTGNGTHTFTLADNLPQDRFSLGGEWTISDEKAQTGKNAVLNYNFNAKMVFLVLRPGASKSNKLVKVFLDGKPIDNSNAGQDVKDGVITVDSDRLYNLIDLKGKSGNHSLRLEFQTPGTEVYAFTFG